MKFVFIADLHLRPSNPACRNDDYHEAQYRKMSFIIDYANKVEAVICIAGDVFDKRDSPAWHVNKYIDLFRKSKYVPYVVFGNHDQYFHSADDYYRTQLGTMLLSGCVYLLGKAEAVTEGRHVVSLSGRSWNDEYHEPVDTADVKILVAHTTVTENKPPDWLTGAVSAYGMMDLHPEFDLIVTGDFHEKFVAKQDGRVLLNTGPLTRSDINKAAFEPALWVYDTATKELEEVLIPIDKNVFNESVAVEFRDSKDFSGFEEALSMTGNKPNFSNLVEAHVNSEGVRAGVKNLALEILEKCQTN